MDNITKTFLCMATLGMVLYGCYKEESPSSVLPAQQVQIEQIALKDAPLFQAKQKEFIPDEISELYLKGIVFGDGEQITKALQSGANINYRSSDGSNGVALALSNKQYTILDNIINLGADINVPDSLGRTPLMIAASMGNNDLAGKLIARGANVNAYDADGNNAAAYAVSCDTQYCIDIFNSLLNADSDIYYKNKYGFSLTDMAYIRRNISLLERFKVLDIPHSAESNILLSERFVFDSAMGNLTFLEAYLQEGGDINYIRKTDGHNALLSAAGAGDTDTVRYLLENGADATITTAEGMTAEDILNALHQDPNYPQTASAQADMSTVNDNQNMQEAAIETNSQYITIPN